MYEALLVLTALPCLAAIAVGAWYYHDAFHPLVWLGALLGVLYVYYPANLVWRGDIRQFFDDESLAQVQTVFLVGVVSTLVGVWKGAGGPIGLAVGVVSTEEQRRRLRIGAIVLGMIGVGAFAYGIINVGGFGEAYGKGYGGGWHDSGYVRDTPMLALPALLWLMAAYHAKRPGWMGWAFIALIASPFLVQGLLGGRRGPTFMGVVGVTVGWYFMRRRRPRLVTVLAGGAALGMALLILVTNRGQIYLGSDFQLEQNPMNTFQAGSGNEYLYGGALVLHAESRNEYNWGGRYFQMYLVRPIPKEIWPTKYVDTAEWLGVPNIDRVNSGLATRELMGTVGWRPAIGSAPGLLADVWVDLWWLSMLVLFGLGWVHGRAWRKATIQGGPWIPCFGIMVALSVYLVMQGLDAMVYRALLMLGGSSAVWFASKWGTARTPGWAGLRAQAAVPPPRT